jgi:FkbM family methyltransferase
MKKIGKKTLSLIIMSLLNILNIFGINFLFYLNIYKKKIFIPFDKISYKGIDFELAYFDYFNKLQQFYPNTKLIKKFGKILDIGSHIGSFGLGFNNPYSIDFVEPSDKNLVFLNKNIEINESFFKKTKIRIFRGVADSKNGKAILSLQPSSTVGYVKKFIPSYHLSKNERIVNAFTLQKIMSKEKFFENSILKVDCEGSEDRIITNNNLPIITKYFTYLIIELHPNIKNKIKILTLLKKNFLIKQFKRGKYLEIYCMNLTI